jgi:hypothetical protein
MTRSNKWLILQLDGISGAGQYIDDVWRVHSNCFVPVLFLKFTMKGVTFPDFFIALHPK